MSEDTKAKRKTASKFNAKQATPEEIAAYEAAKARELFICYNVVDGALADITATRNANIAMNEIGTGKKHVRLMVR